MPSERSGDGRDRRGEPSGELAAQGRAGARRGAWVFDERLGHPQHLFDQQVEVVVDVAVSRPVDREAFDHRSTECHGRFGCELLAEDTDPPGRQQETEIRLLRKLFECVRDALDDCLGW